MLDINEDEFPKHFCSVPWLQIHTEPDGKVFPCCYYSHETSHNLGNWNKSKLTDIFYGEGFNKLRKEFIEGKRLQYLNPVRMYVFTSALYFFFVYTIYGNKTTDDQVQSSDFVTVQDTVDIETSSGYQNVQSYEEAQSKLPIEKKDSWIKKWTVKQEIRLVNKFKNDSKGTIAGIQKEFLKSLPSLMFISLPFLALLLQLIFVRRKSVSYVDHLLFLIHFYIFSFILSFFFINALLLTSFDWLSWMGWVATAIMVWICLYPLLAMRNFYQLGWGGAIFRYSTFVIGSFFIFFFLFIIYLILSLLKV